MDQARSAEPGTDGAPPEAVRFGRFELQPHERRLLVDGQETALGPRAFDLLLALAENVGSLVTRNELIERVWAGVVVEENNLSVQVHALRRVLGSDVVVTVPGRGYRLVVRPDLVAPAAATPALRTHLPVETAPLLGRVAELAQLTALTARHPLVTVTGAGGIGKTRLAQALMQQQCAAFRDGVCWIDLGPLRDGSALPGLVATALGLGVAGGQPAALMQAAAALDILITLDSAEHLLDAVTALVQGLLERAPHVRLLVTSQAPLRLAAEHVLRLGPLTVPALDSAGTNALEFSAVALFAERAQAADSRFVLAESHLPGVVEICRRLDGLPLAIELAAARAPALGIEPLRAALSERLSLLTATRNRLAPSRQQTLRAALEWSYSLLGTREQRLFRRLAVLAGSASLALIQHLAGDDAPGPNELDEWGVLDALDQLVQRSLVEVSGAGPERPAREPRYRLLESPRALALERLRSSGEEQTMRRRHVRAVLAEFEKAEQAVLAGAIGVEVWRGDGEADLLDARQAIAWAVDAGDVAHAIELASTLIPRLPPALHDEQQRLAERCEALLESTPDLDPTSARRGWSAIALALGFTRPQRSVAAAMQALALVRAHPAGIDRPVLYEVLCEAARAAADAEWFAQADELLQEARALEDPQWPPVRLRMGLRAASFMAAARGEPELALRLRRRLLALSLAAGDLSLSTRVNIANLELQSGDAAAAVETGRALVTALGGLRDESRLALARINLAAAYLALSQGAAARDALQAALPTALRMAYDAPSCHAAFVDYLALLATVEGRHAVAAQLIGASDQRHAMTEVREPNEAAAWQRARSIAIDALGAARFEALCLQGETLSNDDMAELAFGTAR